MVGVWDAVIGGSLADAEKPGALLDFLFRRRGPLTSTVAEAFLYASSDGGDGPPDVQFHLAPAYFVDNGFEEYDGHAITLSACFGIAMLQIGMTESDILAAADRDMYRNKQQPGVPGQR